MKVQINDEYVDKETYDYIKEGFALDVERNIFNDNSSGNDFIIEVLERGRRSDGRRIEIAHGRRAASGRKVRVILRRKGATIRRISIEPLLEEQTIRKKKEKRKKKRSERLGEHCG